jgi:hypothetical protein
LAPLAETKIGDGHCATPDTESAQAKVTVTLVLFQPAASGAGEPDATTVGGVLSILIFGLIVAVTPALFTAVPRTT